MYMYLNIDQYFIHNSKHFKCHWKFMHSGLNSKNLTSHPDTCVPIAYFTQTSWCWIRYREKAILLRITCLQIWPENGLHSGGEFFDQENKQTNHTEIITYYVYTHIIHIFFLFLEQASMCIQARVYEHIDDVTMIYKQNKTL